MAATAATVIFTMTLSEAAPIQTGGSQTVTGNGGAINGMGASGYFVQGGTLTINDATLTNFKTTGGAGSGGAAALGGAIFLNSGATVVLNNVNFTNNSVKGGQGGAGNLGGALNGVITGGTGSTGSAGTTPNQNSFTDIGGTNGTKGANAAFSLGSIGGTGGAGGAGGNGGDRSESLILSVTTASLNFAASILEVAGASQPFTLSVLPGLILTSAANAIDLGNQTAALIYFDKSLSEGQIGLGGSGSGGGNGGAGDFGLGGGLGGKGGDGGIGGKNWSGSAYQGGAAGGDAGGGGFGGFGGFGGGGGRGGDGGTGGGGAGVTATPYQAAVPATYKDLNVPASYKKGYYNPANPTEFVITEDNLASSSSSTSLIDHDGNSGTPNVLVQTILKSAARVEQIIDVPGQPEILASSAGQRPNGQTGSGGAGGAGGFGAGSGGEGTGSSAKAAGGNGGNGYGGSIFVRDGGNLTITGNATFGGNSVRGGGGEIGDINTSNGTAGSGSGNDIFMMTGSNVTLDAGVGNVITFNAGAGSSIADDSASTLGGSTPITAGSGASLTTKSGLVIFNGTNTYSGQTKINGGALQAQDGTGINIDSNINFNGGVLQSNGDFIRYVGTSPNQVQWTGSGGFSAAGGDLRVSLNDGLGQALATQKWGTFNFVPDGSSLLFGSTSATGKVTFVNSIDLAGGNRSILVEANSDNSNHAILTGVLSNGSLTVGNTTKTGTLVLTAANTYAGPTLVNAGTVILEGSLASTSVTIANGAALNDINSGLGDATVATVNGSLNFSADEKILTLNGSGITGLGANRLTVSNGAFSGMISGTGGITKISSGVLALSGASTYTGSTLIDAGTLALSGSLVSDAVTVASGATLTNTSGGLSSTSALTNNGIVNQDSNDTVATLVNTGTINNSNFTLTAATYALNSGSVVNANLGTGTVNANGTVALNGTSSAATFNVLGGTTTLGSAERLLDTTALTISSGATLRLGGAEKIGSLFGPGSLNNMGFLLTADSGTFSGVISGSGGLTKLSTGLLTLSGTNTFTGPSLVSAGTVTLSGSLASSIVTVASGASLNVTNSGLAPAAAFTNNGITTLTLDDTVGSYTSTGTLNGPGKLNAGSYNLNGGSIINTKLGAGNLTTNGIVVLNAVSDSLRVTINSGSTLTLNGAQLLNAGASAFINGTLNLSAGDQTLRDINGSGIINVNAFKLIVTSGTSSNTFTGTINAGSTKIISDGGILNLSGGTTTTQTTEVNNGGTLNIINGQTLNTSGLTVTGPVIGGSILYVDGASRVNSALITVNGTLRIPHSSALAYSVLTGTGLIDLQGGTFTNLSAGTVKGFLTFNGNFFNNGIFAPGNSPGLTTILGNYTEAGTLQAELETTTPITGHDQIRVGGTVTLNSGSSLVVQTFNGATPVRGANYQVIANLTGGSKAVSGTFGSIRYDADGLAGPSLPVINAAVIFDQATGRVISTGLNNTGSTFADLGDTTNQRLAAAALLTAATTPVGQNQINTSTSVGRLAEQVISANGGSATNLERFTPEFYGAISDYSLSGQRDVNHMLRSRVNVLSDLPGQDAEGFSAFSGINQRHLATGNAADGDRTNIYAGGDYAVSSHVSVGIVATYNNGDISSTYGESEVDGLAGDIYVMAKINPSFDVYGRIGYGSDSYDLTRTTTDIIQAVGTTDSDVFSTSVGVTYAGWKWGEVSFAPTADLTYSHASVDGFTETGANDSLTLGDYDATNLIAQVGASIVWSTKLNGRQFSAELVLGIEQRLINDKGDQTATMVNAPVSFTQTFDEGDSTSAAVGVNFGYGVTDNTTIYCGYSGNVSSNSTGNFNAGVRVNF